MEIRLRSNSFAELELLFKLAMESLKKKLKNEDKNLEMVTHPDNGEYMVDPIG